MLLTGDLKISPPLVVLLENIFALSIGTFFSFFFPHMLFLPLFSRLSVKQWETRSMPRLFYIVYIYVCMCVYIRETTIGYEMKKKIPKRTPIEELLHFWAITRFPNLCVTSDVQLERSSEINEKSMLSSLRYYFFRIRFRSCGRSFGNSATNFLFLKERRGKKNRENTFRAFRGWWYVGTMVVFVFFFFFFFFFLPFFFFFFSLFVHDSRSIRRFLENTLVRRVSIIPFTISFRVWIINILSLFLSHSLSLSFSLSFSPSSSLSHWFYILFQINFIQSPIERTNEHTYVRNLASFDPSFRASSLYIFFFFIFPLYF